MPIVIANPAGASTPWSIAGAAESSTFDVSLNGNVFYGMTFSTDGTKMYISDGGNSAVWQYNLSTAWEISTASYSTFSKSIAAQNLTPGEIAFSSDGSKMYVLGVSSPITLFQYTLSTPWKVDTANYDGTGTDYVPTTGSARGFTMSDDGTKLYIIDPGDDTITRYSLTTPWSIAAVTDDLNSYDTSLESTFQLDLSFGNNGNSMFTSGFSSKKISQYTLGTAWDSSSANYDNVSLNVADGSGPEAVTLNSTGTRIYVLARAREEVIQYNL